MMQGLFSFFGKDKDAESKFCGILYVELMTLEEIWKGEK